jgi:hypothetical protein
MGRTTTRAALSIALLASAACARDERSRASTIDLSCTDPACTEVVANPVRPSDASASTDSSSVRADAAGSADAATTANTFDGFVPPFDSGGAAADVATAANGRDAVPDTLPPFGPLPDTTVCANASPDTLAFRTDFLDAVEPRAGSGIPAAPLAFRTAWHRALTNTAAPGPALLVLSNLGLMSDGGVRRMRFGTPTSRPVNGGAAGVVFAFESPSLAATPNPLAAPFNVQNTTKVSGSLFDPRAVGLRFADAAGARYDIPVVAMALDAYLRSDVTGACTALDVVDLALAFASTAFDATLDGTSLGALLGTSGAASSLAVVHFSGPAAVVAFEEAP